MTGGETGHAGAFGIGYTRGKEEDAMGPRDSMRLSSRDAAGRWHASGGRGSSGRGVGVGGRSSGSGVGRIARTAALGALAAILCAACGERADEPPAPEAEPDTAAQTEVQPDPAPSEPVRPEAAAKAVAQLKSRLAPALHAALAESPEAAIEVCNVQAPAIAADVARPGLAIGRTSHRLRNPANAPEPWMLPFLEEFRTGPPQPGAWRTADLGDGRTGYVEPIYLQPMCATCHGENVDPALLEKIRELYPEDEAVGFRVGELRGMFWVVLSEEAAGAAAGSAAN